jgi:hypothetical protein
MGLEHGANAASFGGCLERLYPLYSFSIYLIMPCLAFGALQLLRMKNAKHAYKETTLSE